MPFSEEIFIEQVSEEIILLKSCWMTFTFIVLFHLLHSVFTNLVYYLYDYYQVFEHDPLDDLGFKMFKGGLDEDRFGWISEFLTFTTVGNGLVFIVT